MPTGPTATSHTLHESTRVHENGIQTTDSHTWWTEKRGPANHVLREAGLVHAPASLAASGFREMLYHFQRELLGDIENLTGLTALKIFPVSQIAPAVLAGVGLMDDHAVGGLHALQADALMAVLAALFAPRALPQAALLRRGL